jgi:hypothetical protein
MDTEVHMKVSAPAVLEGSDHPLDVQVDNYCYELG